MKKRLQRMLPKVEAIRKNRWLRWLGPALEEPRLWHFSRRGIALGVALGVFFGLLIPIAQIPVSAAAAIIFRANVPSAIASTLITNPVTFGPIYYTAYRIGSTLLGETPPPDDTEEQLAHGHQPLLSWDNISSLGKPLLLGLAIIATLSGLLAYQVVTWIWRLKTMRAWKRRRQSASNAKPIPPEEK